ncbi:MAG TPA: hypothetical protein DDY78_19325 [Planctomycetales bacterium]|jgi:hypothetical protein|nr:hypothetical protein [Planctomycetales bacterium]
MDAEPLTQLRAVAVRMRELKPVAEATVFYELTSDALVWSDEIPDAETSDVSDFQCLRFLFRFRTTLMMGAPDERFRSLWDEARNLFPDWHGFDPRRQAVEYRPVYLRFCEQAKPDIRELFDKPAC